MVTLKVFLAYVLSLIGKRTDYDGYYGAQCVDLIGHVYQKFWNFTPWGNAIDYMTNAMPAGFKRYKKGETQIQAGDIAIWKWGPGDKFGHISIVTAVNGRMITSVDQNVDGNWDYLTVGGPARLQTRNDTYLVGFIRPVFQADPANDKATTERYWTRVPERASFTLTVDKINVRNEPSTKTGKIVATYKKGELVNYDSYTIANGYVWISYVSTSGARRYMAIGEWDGHRRTSVWGTFK